MALVPRHLQDDLVALHARPRGRLLVLTGARQVGKSTLARMAFPDLPVIALDAPTERVVYERLTPDDWLTRFPRAVIDEAQKLPPVFDTIKACYDRSPDARYVLLGSSQVLLLKGVRESLAGRAALRELYPFSLPEIAAARAGAPGESAAERLLAATDPSAAARELFPPDAALRAGPARAAWEQFLCWGGMPVLHASDWSDDDRFDWLQDYQTTYLQRDLADLAQLDRLEPFVRAQRAAALRTAQTINFAELARLSGVSPPTARQFLRYLELSYQVVLLPGWFRNAEKRLAKQPKLHFLDPGVRRAVLAKRGAVDGAEFESAVVAELWKLVRTRRLAVEPYHLRTHDGREVDLLLEREDGFIAIECKQSEHVASTDFRHLRGLETFLDRPLLLGLVLSSDPNVARFEGTGPPLLAVPAEVFLGPARG